MTSKGSDNTANGMDKFYNKWNGYLRNHMPDTVRFHDNNNNQMELDQANDKIKQLQKQLEYYTMTIDSNLSEEILDHLKQHHEQRIVEINTAEDQKIQCVKCGVNDRNIVILQCSHLLLCDGCELSMQIKKCPKCNVSYQKVLKINDE